MSRQIIITDIVPILVKIMERKGVFLPSEATIRDEQLFDFLEQELLSNFSICGSADHCKALEEAIAQANTQDPEAFLEYIKLLLNKYLNIRLTVDQAKKLSENPKQIVKILTDGKAEGVPDRFTEFRKRNPYGPDKWIRKRDMNNNL